MMHEQDIRSDPDMLDVSLTALNDINHLKVLERRAVAETILRQYPSFEPTDTTISRQLSSILLNFNDSERALEAVRTLPFSTATQRSAIMIPNEEFHLTFQHVKDEIAQLEPTLDDVLTRRQSKVDHVRGQINWNDRYQTKQFPRRDLEHMRRNGVVIEIDESQTQKLRENKDTLQDDPSCPILEHIKNDRIFTINGLRNSKSSLTIHDLFDHYWTYDLLDNKGFFSRYKKLLNEVGNPHLTDLFKRESEMIATISFGTRLYSTSEPGFSPIFNLDRIKRIFNKSSRAGTLTDNQAQAQELLESYDPEGESGKSLSYVVSNMAIEQMEQRRKHGSIKKLNPDTYMPESVLKLLDPEYIALITEVHHLLTDPTTEANENLLKISVIVEEYLVRLAKSLDTGEISSLVVKIDAIRNFDLSQSILSEKRIDWLREHAGFASTKTHLC